MHAKQLWKNIVQEKINAQHQVLVATNTAEGDALAEMIKRIKSGDPENTEAQAARRYWPMLMGKDFLRDVDAQGANSLLNYGYAILRATVARAIISVGLHPSLGVHHQNRLNAFCLVDDMMEPYRPAVDFTVFNLLRSGHTGVTADTKKSLVGLMQQQVRMPQEITSISNAVLYSAQSLVQCFTEGKKKLVFPEQIIPQAPDIE